MCFICALNLRSTHTHLLYLDVMNICYIPWVKPNLNLTDDMRNVVPGLRRKTTKLLLCSPKFSFQTKVILTSHFENQSPWVWGTVDSSRYKISVTGPHGLVIESCCPIHSAELLLSVSLTMVLMSLIGWLTGLNWTPPSKESIEYCIEED